MARGKIQIKRIENQTNRQVTYSKRRNGLFKKAHELTVLCDARVSIIMFSSSNKLHEYISPNTTTKEIVDLYQTISDVDVWATQYERMQETKRKLLETNRNLRTQIKQRLGECLDELDIQELRRLEDEMENTFKLVRERKFKSLGNQIETTKKKNKSQQDIQKNLIHELELRAEDPHYGLVDNGGDYDSVLGYQIEGSRAYALRFHQNHHHYYPNHGLHAPSASDIITFHLLE
ncbi:Floral homeotic protein APETALA 3 [Arabidopsis thaliana]|uniref:Floral homeotic protein APETALA 3 n=4 Tax=Arabidopsis TaxID=3701 RepID=AP3_ARATH|nr:K-box region and MADS-box transcription factor family protein [Arabidopsis thaliana]P35632.1 RecName: Full=Floral homeotic protein APETALA 3 [Arabidopsis thaliana]KAG7628470.1 Transcription factor MADS-box [Arabidopsis thaliana x Arabidopsis arenosa]KAG7634380.1 Transcription factor MADS-box [Arabidopsis suecica]AAA32740.1 APETELA3 [Arabidopsis thaliana]AAD51888.1 floral homeotic protein AP3 [Arabidopsis thaliana]AAD51889.1 floral homeotic protein AP3 [Arabidopsis thaliana]|eukprot:NP_191002.1 K-box region and MADS-box transcription factor family protein [Arabidopsis thaliana]